MNDCKEEQTRNALRGLVMGLPLVALFWGVIAACVTWPIFALILGVVFTVVCFWLAWVSRRA